MSEPQLAQFHTWFAQRNPAPRTHPDRLTAVPPAPASMAADVRSHYEAACALLLQAGILSCRDVPAVISYAETQAELAQVQAILDEDGLFFPAGFGKKAHAGLVERRALQDRLLRYQKQLGFTPVSRQQVEAPIEHTEFVSRRVKAS